MKYVDSLIGGFMFGAGFILAAMLFKTVLGHGIMGQMKSSKKKEHSIESPVVKSCIEWLRWHPELGQYWRQNSGSVSKIRRKTGKTGVPDIIGFSRRGIFIGIECKGDEGKQSPAQKEFQNSLEKSGGIYILARSVDDLEKYDWFNLSRS